MNSPITSQKDENSVMNSILYITQLYLARNNLLFGKLNKLSAALKKKDSSF